MCDFCCKDFPNFLQDIVLLPFPNITPEIFSFEFFGIEFALRWYALSYIVGFYFAIKIMKYFVRREVLWQDQSPPMTPDDADRFLSYLILGVIIGGRLGYVLFYNFGYYLKNPSEIIQIWDGGMAFHGGFLGVIVSVILFCRSNAIPVWSGADLIAVSTPPGLFLGRLANFINAELWGRPTDAPWGVIFPGERASQCGDFVGACSRHPTQLYEAALEGLFLFILLFILCRLGSLKNRGMITGYFAVVYGFSRFFVEYYRVPDPQFFSNENPFGYAFTVNGFGLTMGQTLSLPMIVVGFILIIVSLQKPSKVPK